MNMVKRLILYSICYCFCAGCTMNITSDIHRGDESILYIEDAIDNATTINLSKYASNINYIPLNGTLIGNIGNFIATDDFFYFKTSSMNATIMKFNKNGNFIGQVGKYGRGPEEVIMANNFFIEQDYSGKENVGISDLQSNLLIYNSNNDCIKCFQRRDIENKLHCTIISDKGYFENNLYYILARVGKAATNEFLFVVDSSLNIVSQADLGEVFIMKKTMTFDNITAKQLNLSSSKISYNHPYESYIWKFKEDLRIAKGKGDTIYSFLNACKNHSLSNKEATYIIDYGKYRSNDKSEISDDEPIIFLAEKSLESKKFVIFGFRFQSYIFQSLLRAGIPTEKVFDSFVLYDKTENKTYAIKHDLKKGTIGFTNDLDGGMNFWPQYAKEDKMYQLVNAIDFIEMAEQSTSARMKEVAAQLTEESNPVMVVVTLR